MPIELWALLVVLFLGGAGLASVVWRRRRQTRDEAEYARNIERNLHVPASLHPVIDANICIGSLSCLQACPEGDILGIVDGKAHLIRGANCIGHGRCMIECPVGAIRLVFGTSERGVDLPEIDERFETNRPGVHIIGELGGMGLIKNAIAQGVQVAEHLAKVTAPALEEMVDAVIVGAGPAGLAAAVALHDNRRTFRILDQGTLGGTIAAYPRQKLVMSEPVDLPGHGRFGKPVLSKEELLDTWSSILKRHRIRIDEGVKVTGLKGTDGNFEVETDQGVVETRKVILATGRRGSPRKLGVPGEEMSKVTYRLIAPEQYNGRKILVVGGGDSALEAAIMLAEESKAEVSLSYRGEELGRCREANRDRFMELAGQGRIQAIFNSQVQAIRETEVDLAVGAEKRRLANDYVMVQIGGELPLEFLSRMGVEVQRFHGSALERREQARTDGHTKPANLKVLTKRTPDEIFRRRLALGLFALGTAIIAALVVVGYPYYVIPVAQRSTSDLHKTLRPAGTWGHGVGVVATAFLMSNFLYSVRKRWRRLKGTATIRTWLTFHMFVGFMSPLVIAFHAAFQSNNQLATYTAGSLLVVVITGIVGRYVYGLVPAQGGTALQLAEVEGRFENLRGHVEPLLAEIRDPAPLRKMFSAATADAKPNARVGMADFVIMLIRYPLEVATLQARLLWVTRDLKARQHAYEFRSAMMKLHRIRAQLRFYPSLKKLLSGWRLFHAVTAGLLVFMIAAHIAVSLYFGYRWIF